MEVERRYIGCMLWTFERSGRLVHYEIRRSLDSSQYELVFQDADGHEAHESFEREAEVLDRARSLQRELFADGWFLAGDPRR